MAISATAQTVAATDLHPAVTIDEPDQTHAPRAAALTGAERQLLRSAVSLQAEDLLRTIGALAQEQRDVRQWSALVEGDVRDLAVLATCAVRAGASLPAGFDTGSGDPGEPGSVIEGLLASHQALARVLTQLVGTSDPRVAHIAGDVLARREEESLVLRGLGAGRGLPPQEDLIRGRLAKFQG